MDIVALLTADQIGVLLQGITLAAGGIAVGVGLWQYSKPQTWKRHELVAGEYRAFVSDPLARNAMLMIDWGTRNIEPLPTHPDYNARFPTKAERKRHEENIKPT